MTDFTQLAIKLAQAKAAEDAARSARIAVESEIYGAAQAAGLLINDIGTNHVGPITVSRGETRKWDQPKLHSLAAEIPADISPIRGEYKVDKKLFDALEETHPDLHKKLLEALTTKLNKPTFKLSKEIAA